MENFSTPQHAMLPRLANLLTVAVVLAATWWSSAQRPEGPATEASIATPPAGHLVPAQQSPNTTPTPAATQATWPAQTTWLPADSLQAVGYQPARRQ